MQNISSASNTTQRIISASNTKQGGWKAPWKIAKEEHNILKLDSAMMFIFYCYIPINTVYTLYTAEQFVNKQTKKLTADPGRGTGQWSPSRHRKRPRTARRESLAARWRCSAASPGRCRRRTARSRWEGRRLGRRVTRCPPPGWSVPAAGSPGLKKRGVFI